MRRISVVLGAGLVAFILASCGTTEPTALPAPENVEFTIADTGKTLVITWSAVENASGYKVFCDDEEIADLDAASNSFAINADEYGVCRVVKVAAYDNGGNLGDAYMEDLLYEAEVTVYSTDDPNPDNPSWVKIDFTNFAVNAVTQSSVVSEDNVGYFVYYYDSNLGARVFKDASQTSVGQVREEITFTNNTDAVLAPSTGYSYISEIVDEGDRYIFWSDDVDNGDFGDFDAEDNFGIIKVNSISGTEANLTIYIQKVGGLRWVKE